MLLGYPDTEDMATLLENVLERVVVLTRWVRKGEESFVSELEEGNGAGECGRPC